MNWLACQPPTTVSKKAIGKEAGLTSAQGSRPVRFSLISERPDTIRVVVDLSIDELLQVDSHHFSAFE